MSTMSDYLRRQAARCTGWSRECFDLEAAGRLPLMAEEFRAKASEIEATQNESEQDEPDFDYPLSTTGRSSLQARGNAS